ncbi:MAG TPA: CHASE3 domain-containing protein [Alphaproteobacteria bacterium]|nr:CHASE3 domain-containing protein [Alphaproteobacteria bacterium]
MIERGTLRQAMFWLAVLTIVIANLFAYRSLTDLMEVGRKADNAQYSLYHLERVLSLLKDAETGQRGYLLSGDDGYLEPYRLAISETPSALRELNEIVNGNQRQRDRIEELARLAMDQLATLAQGVVDRRMQGPAILDSAVLADGKRRMDRIRDLVAQMLASEQGSIAALNSQVNRQAQFALFALAGGTLFSLAGIVGVFLWLTREGRYRRQLQHELRALNAQLEERVVARTAELADVNDNLRNESEQRAAAVDSLRDSNELLNAVMRSTPLAVILLDAEGKVAVWNAAAERFFGYAQAEALGHPPQVLGRNAEGASADLVALASAAGAQGCDAEFDRRDGKVLQARVIAVPLVSQRLPGGLRASGSASASLLILVEDVTARASVEQQLRQAQKMEVVGQLTGGVAHDFNNLLTIIVGNGDLALEEVDETSQTAEYLRTVLRAAARGAELTQRLLAFARKQTLRPRVLDVNSLLPNLGGMLQRVLGEHIVVSSLPAEGLWPALVDPSQVEDAILNLAINARDAMPRGGQLVVETRNVTLDEDYLALNPEALAGDYVMFSVADTGHGMTPEVLEHVFEPFFTTKEQGKGTGLGLSMIYGFVKQSGGHIKIYSEVGHGTTVRVYLPRAKPGEGEAVAPQPVAVVPSGRETVLVVEDNVEVRRVALRIMKELGYRTIEAENADAACKMLEEGAAPDVLFTDIVMPGKLNGYDLAKLALKRNPHLKVLFTSGYSEVFLRQGADGVRAEMISKPYRKQELALRLRAAIDAPAE